jgi:hypothetical protein
MLKTPVEEVSRVYQQAGFPPDPTLEQNIQSFLAQQRSGGRARPRDQMSNHGYTREKVEHDPALASYLERYKVVLEEKRNTGVV